MEEVLTFIDGREYKGMDYYNNLSKEEIALEKLKCRMSLLYWVETYAYAPVTGGNVHMGTSEQWKSSPKFRILFKLFEHEDAVLLLSSRQIGKSTMALMYAMWAMIFFPGIEIMFLTLDSSLAKDAVVRLTGISDSLPYWMQVPNASKAAKATYMYLKNDSKFKTSFISGAVDPNKAGRGLSQSIIILDEFAFCNHADLVYSSMQPSVATARMHAKRNGYPTLVLAVSTPNGGGENTFYQMLQRSVSIDDLYDFENKVMYENYEEHFTDESNSFISVQIHWSETHRDESWYKQQCKDLNFNQRRINQELDLAFLGSSDSIFSDEIISELIIKKPFSEITLPFGNKFKLFSDIDPSRTYLLGADTSASTGVNSDFCSLSLMDAISGQEVGVWKGKFSVVKKFSHLLKHAVKGLNQYYNLTSDNLIVIIERNSFGKGVVEELVYNDPMTDDFDYASYVWQDSMANGDLVYGFWTGNAGKLGNGRRDQMFSELMNHVNQNPTFIHSNELISELRNLVQKTNGRIEASKSNHDDVVMAFNFCLYVRKLMITSGEIIVDGEITAFQLTAESMNSFIGAVFGEGNYFESRQQDEEIIFEKYDKQGNRINVQRELSLDDYIIM